MHLGPILLLGAVIARAVAALGRRLKSASVEDGRRGSSPWDSS
jgi:hypothetical protein